MNWKPHADRLAAEATHPVSRWRPVVAAVPRHVFARRWWGWSAPGDGPGADIWELRDGPADPVLYSALGVTVPGVLAHHYEESREGQRTAWMLAPDGSWARAVGTGGGPPVVHQSGQHRLWDILDGLRHTWLRDGSLPAYGATVTITSDGGIHLKRGRWQAAIPAG